ncbi:MAG: 50S ribosomal protein L11 methyltransferase [Nanoarchaeota archaeon]|nr:50S ribosomal protein L11 methyltransferase [Nanoarchaeota archaeon]
MSRINYNKPKYGQGKGEFDLAYHYEMVSDAERTGQFKKAIMACCKDKVVLEIGPGTGILTLLAAKAGAKKVYAVEIDPAAYRVAKRNIEASGYSNIVLLNKDIFEFEPPEKIEVVIAELLSTCLVNEPQVLVMNHVTKFLAPGAVTLPHRVVNIVEGADVDYRFEDVVVKAPFFEFTGIKNARIVTESRMFETVEFGKENPVAIDRVVELTCLTKARLNSIRFTSIVNIHGDVNFYSTDSLMPPVVVPLAEPVDVEPGQKVLLRIKHKYNTDWDEGVYEIVRK